MLTWDSSGSYICGEQYDVGFESTQKGPVENLKSSENSNTVVR